MARTSGKIITNYINNLLVQLLIVIITFYFNLVILTHKNYKLKKNNLFGYETMYLNRNSSALAFNLLFRREFSFYF